MKPEVRALTYRRAFWIVLTIAAAAACQAEPEQKTAVDESALVRPATRPRNATCTAGPRPSQGAVKLTRVYPRVTLDRGISMSEAPGQPGRWMAIEQAGRVVAFDDRPDATTTVFADLRDRVFSGAQEAGLLGLAFHPQYAQNRRVFLSYTTKVGGQLRSRVSRFVATPSMTSLDVGSESILLEFDQPFDNHNGGNLAFGPDGFLYAGFGDGGGAGDPQRSAQRLDTLLGKIVRLDIDGAAPYAIPADNPFVGRPGARAEIFALGFRNPWRFSFDRTTGALWAGDVGQDSREEVDRVVKGGNYGWSLREASACFRAPCTAPGIIDPVAEYTHAEGKSITGGYVYRGSALASLGGAYVYGDFVSGKLWALGEGEPPRVLIESSGLSIAGFAQRADGELFILNYADGGVHRLDPAGPVTLDRPALLSQTGCMNADEPWRPGPGLLAYDVNAPLWSDGAAKQRWIALPDGARIGTPPNKPWDFPNGTVFVKQFTAGSRRIETRFLMRHTDGSWAGYTYAWNPEGTDATLVTAGRTIDVAGKPWSLPSRGECMECHTTPAGRALGFRAGQLNRDLSFSDGTRDNQLSLLTLLGYFAPSSGPLGSPPALPPPDGTAPLADRARAYLDANCAGCHRPKGPGRGGLDLRFEVPFGWQGVCDVAPSTGDLGIAGARIVAPGDPERSVLYQRMKTRGAEQMPPLGTHVVDTAGTELVRSWITSLAGCGDVRRTVVFMKKQTQPGQDIFLRGGLDHGRAAEVYGVECTANNRRCAIPIQHRIKGRGAGDTALDWYGTETTQPAGAVGSPLSWTTDAWPPSWGPSKRVTNDGFGVEPLNSYGPHYWMLDVDMDCARTSEGWFETKAFVTNGDGWEPAVQQPGAPWASTNHVVRCGVGTVLEWGQGPVKTFDLPSR